MRNILFPSNKTLRRLITIVHILIQLVAVWAFISKPELFNSALLSTLSELNFTIVLAIAALGISVLQMDGCLQAKKEDQNLVLNYVFEMFLVILCGILGYVSSIFFQEWEFAIKCLTLGQIEVILMTINSTMVYFVEFFNIRD